MTETKSVPPRQRVREWLKQVGALHRLDGVTLERALPQGDPVEVHAWSASRELPRLVLLEREFPFATARARLGKLLVAGDVERLPVQARVDRESFLRHGVRAVLSIPVHLNGARFDLVALGYRGPRLWKQQLVGELRLLGKLFAAMLSRASMEDELRRVAGLLNTVLAAVPGMVAVVDATGRITRTNQRWLKRVAQGQALFRDATVGTSYSSVLAQTEAKGDHRAGMLRRGLNAALGEDHRGMTVGCFPEGGARGPSFVTRIEPIAAPEQGAVVVFTDSTAQHRATQEAERLRGQLAHMQRVATVSELAGAFVHELKQPLTAILSNAQASQRLLQQPRPDVDEIASALSEICASDRRAGDLLQNLHSFLRPGEVIMQAVNLNALLREVLWLCKSDVRLRHVNANLTLDPRLPPVMGDKVQLQQVMLNLLLNALDALGKGNGNRRLQLRTMREPDHRATVLVSDTGPGIPKNRLERIFQSFFTTKPQGLGMGLAIARRIVEAHGGEIRAANNRGRGATVSVTLPSELRSQL